MATTNDVRPVEIVATGDYHDPLDGYPLHSYLMLDVNGLQPGGRFKIQCSHELCADEGDLIDPAHDSYVTDAITDWAVPESAFRNRFSDIQDDVLAAQAYALYLKKIVSGVDERHFAPVDSLTRAQFAGILSRVLSQVEVGVRDSSANAVSFADVPQNAWYKKAVESVVTAGLMQGTEPGKFAPNEKVTREQLLAIVGRLVAYDPASWQCTAEGEEKFLELSKKRYSDWEKISPWALEGMTYCHWAQCDFSSRYLKSDELNPQAPATRMDAVVILHQFLFPTADRGHWVECAREVAEL